MTSTTMVQLHTIPHPQYDPLARRCPQQNHPLCPLSRQCLPPSCQAITLPLLPCSRCTPACHTSSLSSGQVRDTGHHYNHTSVATQPTLCYPAAAAHWATTRLNSPPTAPGTPGVGMERWRGGGDKHNTQRVDSLWGHAAHTLSLSCCSPLGASRQNNPPTAPGTPGGGEGEGGRGEDNKHATTSCINCTAPFS